MLLRAQFGNQRIPWCSFSNLTTLCHLSKNSGQDKTLFRSWRNDILTPSKPSLPTELKFTNPSNMWTTLEVLPRKLPFLCVLLSCNVIVKQGETQSARPYMSSVPPLRTEKQAINCLMNWILKNHLYPMMSPLSSRHLLLPLANKLCSSGLSSNSWESLKIFSLAIQHPPTALWSLLQFLPVVTMMKPLCLFTFVSSVPVGSVTSSSGSDWSSSTVFTCCMSCSPCIAKESMDAIKLCKISFLSPSAISVFRCLNQASALSAMSISSRILNLFGFLQSLPALGLQLCHQSIVGSDVCVACFWFPATHKTLPALQELLEELHARCTLSRRRTSLLESLHWSHSNLLTSYADGMNMKRHPDKLHTSVEIQPSLQKASATNSPSQSLHAPLRGWSPVESIPRPTQRRILRCKPEAPEPLSRTWSFRDLQRSCQPTSWEGLIFCHQNAEPPKFSKVSPVASEDSMIADPKLSKPTREEMERLPKTILVPECTGGVLCVPCELYTPFVLGPWSCCNR